MREIFIEMNKGVVSDEEICLVTNKYKNLLNEIDEAYRCIRTLIVDDNLLKIKNSYLKNNVLVERFKVTSYTICSFIGRSHTKSNEFYRRWYS